MKSGVIFALLFVSQFSFAAAKKYDLKMALSIEGKHITSSAVTITEGDPSTITQNTKDGNETILYRPRIIALEGQEAQISEGTSETEKENFSLRVTATEAKK